MSADTREAPANYEISADDGSAYYLLTAEGSTELIQVPLDADGTPDFAAEDDAPTTGFFGGGAVDWERGIEDDATRQRLLAIENRLREREGLPQR